MSAAPALVGRRRVILAAFAAALLLALVASFAPTRTVAAPVASAVLIPVAAGDYTGWSEDWQELADPVTECSTDASPIVENSPNARKSARLDLSSVPEGSEVVRVDISVCYGEGSDNAGNPHPGGAFQTFYRVGDTDFDAGEDIVTQSGTRDDPVVTTQEIDAAFSVEDDTVLEIGVVHTTPARRVEVYSVNAILYFNAPPPPDRTVRVTKVATGENAPAVSFDGTVGDADWSLAPGNSDDVILPGSPQTIVEDAITEPHWTFGGYAERDGLVSCEGAVYSGARADGIETTGEGNVTICVLNVYTEPTRSLDVCKSYADNGDGHVEAARTFEFDVEWASGSALASVTRAEGEEVDCDTVDLPQSASVTVTERDATGYTVTNSTGTGGAAADVGTGETVTFTNTAADRPLPSVTKAGEAYASGAANWTIVVDNTATGAVSRIVAVTEQAGVEFGAATPCDEGSGLVCTVTVPAGQTLNIGVSAVAAQRCDAYAIDNMATAAVVDPSGDVLVAIGGTGAVSASVPADTSLCDGTLILVLENPAGSPSDVFVSDPTADLSWELHHGESHAADLAPGSYVFEQADAGTVGTGYLAPTYRLGTRSGEAFDCEGAVLASAEATVSALGETIVCITNTPAALPSVTKEAVEPVAGDFAWTIAIDNTAIGSIDRHVALVDEDVTLVASAVCEQDGDTITCGPVPAGESVSVTVTRDAGGPACNARSSSNSVVANLVVAGQARLLANLAGVTATIPGDPSVCAMPLLSLEAAGYADSSAGWRARIDNTGAETADRVVQLDVPGTVLAVAACGSEAGVAAEGLQCEVAAGESLTLELRHGVEQACEPVDLERTAAANAGGSPLQGSPTVAVAVTVPGADEECPATVTVQTYLDADGDASGLMDAPAGDDTPVNGRTITITCEDAGIHERVTGTDGEGVAVFALPPAAGTCTVTLEVAAGMECVGYRLDDGGASVGAAASATFTLEGGEAADVAFFETASANPTPTPTPGSTPRPGESAEPGTPSPSPSATPATPGATETPTPQVTPTTPAATETITPSPSATPGSSPTSTATASPTAAAPVEGSPTPSGSGASPTPAPPETGTGPGSAVEASPFAAAVGLLTVLGGALAIAARGRRSSQ